MSSFKCILHGSFRRHLEEIKKAHAIFTAAGIEVLAPQLTEVSIEADGSVYFKGEEEQDRRMVGKHLCTFDQIKDSGYYQAGVQKIFIDKIVQVTSKHVELNDEAQAYVWMPVQEALRELDIEPNARHTFELYARVNAL